MITCQIVFAVRRFSSVSSSLGRRKAHDLLHANAVEHRGRLKLDEVWDLEIEEAKAAKDGFKLIAMYKVAGQRRVIAIVEIETAEDLDRVILGRLPLREVLEFEAIWPLRSFDSFLDDCRTHFGTKEPAK
jgi:muconolactone D-isomerase